MRQKSTSGAFIVGSNLKGAVSEDESQLLPANIEAPIPACKEVVGGHLQCRYSANAPIAVAERESGEYFEFVCIGQ